MVALQINFLNTEILPSGCFLFMAIRLHDDAELIRVIHLIPDDGSEGFSKSFRGDMKGDITHLLNVAQIVGEFGLLSEEPTTFSISELPGVKHLTIDKRSDTEDIILTTFVLKEIAADITIIESPEVLPVSSDATHRYRLSSGLLDTICKVIDLFSVEGFLIESFGGLVHIYGIDFEATLEFVDKCDREFGLQVVWLEADVNPEKGKGTSFKIVDFESASRQGEPFEAVIAKYGIPNKQFPHCTRELKQLPIRKYMQSLGYSEWITATGIRADEPHRINRGSDSNFMNAFFPLADLIHVDESFIRNWWDRQYFDLNLKDYQSNCDLCWKKSKRKRLTLISENSSVAEWWDRMEQEYGQMQYQFDQRDGLTIVDLVELAKHPFSKAVDKHEVSKMQKSLFEPQMDLEWDCFCKAS